ncbi:hypothetical protein [Mastigocladopsis repens]|nr:hypothetical protein [Mastigocladopsis repens]
MHEHAIALWAAAFGSIADKGWLSESLYIPTLKLSLGSLQLK